MARAEAPSSGAGVLRHFHILPSAPTGGKQEAEVLGGRGYLPGRQLLRPRRHSPACPRWKPGAGDWRKSSSNPGAPGLREPIRTTLLLKSGEGFYLTMATDSLLKGKLRSPLCFLLAQCLMAEGWQCPSLLF